MKKYIDEIFEETGYSEERAAKMDINDLLKYVVEIMAFGIR